MSLVAGARGTPEPSTVLVLPLRRAEPLARLHLGVVLAETVAAIVAAHRSGSATPERTAARSFARIRAHNDPAIFISLRPEADVIADARALGAARNTALPLYGVPVAVKDNIDVAGLPTTAACPAFSYKPSQDSTAVARPCERLAPLSSARPISISLLPAWLGCARHLVSRATHLIQN